MGDAIWLTLSLPVWYFSALRDGLRPDAFVLGAVVWPGVAGLLAGLVIGVRRRQAVLLWLLISPLLSQGLVAVAGVFRGQVQAPLLTGVLLSFLAIQLALLAFLNFRFRNMRASAAALSLFGLSYALFAYFVAAMSFSDTWL